MSDSTHTPIWRRPLVRIAATVLLLALVVRLAMRENFSAVVARISATDLMLVLLGLAIIHTVGLCKWTLLVRATDAKLSFQYAAQCYTTGLFGNIFLPSNIGGDMLSTGMAMRHSNNKLGVVMGTIASRALDLISLLAITAAGVLHPGTWALVSRHAHVLTSGTAGLLVLIVARRPMLRIPKFVPFRYRRGLVSLRRVVRSMAAKPVVFATAFATSLILQSGLMLLNYWVAILCGLHVSIPAWLFAWPLAKLIAFIPISQGGFGTREFALAGLLAPFSAKPELVVAVGLVWDVLLVIAGISGGVIAVVLSRFTRVPELQVVNEARGGRIADVM